MGVAALPVAVQQKAKPGQTLIGPQPGPQTKFLQSAADITVFGGAGGGGKTYGTILYPTRNLRVNGFQSVIFRRTYKRIKMAGGIWDDTHKVYPLLGGKATENDLTWTFKDTGYESTVSFAHMQYTSNMYDYKGLQAAHIAFEELTEFDEAQFFYLKSRNRSTCGVKSTMTATTNPDADSWVKRFLAPWVDEQWPEEDRAVSGELRYFIREDDAIHWLPNGKRHKDATSVRFIVSKLYDNKLLMAADPNYERNLKSLPLVEMRRLLYGDWTIRHQGGKLFKKHWFKVVDTIPGKVVWLARGWDLAATEADDDVSEKSGPDFTATVMVGRLEDGRYIILDTQRMRESPGEVEKAVLNMASQNGHKTSIYMEQEGGSGGKNTIAWYTLKLQGYYFKGVTTTGKGSKVERARPASSQAEAGNILILRTPYTEDFLNELEAFPNPKVHDDWVDAFSLVMSQAFNANAVDLLDELNARVNAREKLREQIAETYW
jgi:predicted phage terminase large subunit-like protein